MWVDWSEIRLASGVTSIIDRVLITQYEFLDPVLDRIVDPKSKS